MKKTKNTSTAGKTFTDEERAAIQEHARELRAEEKMKKDRAAGEKALLTKIAEMSESDRAIAKRLHEIITKNAPGLSPKTWYGMPAYANKEGKVVCFFQAADKFKTRYSSFGFNDVANLDEGNMWPTAFALKKLTSTEESKIIELLKKAVR